MASTTVKFEYVFAHVIMRNFEFIHMKNRVVLKIFSNSNESLKIYVHTKGCKFATKKFF